jgi:hypothetical protein
MPLTETDAKRLEKAKALAKTVTQAEAPPWYRVGVYHVELLTDLTTCDCADYQQRRAYEGKACKHGLAVEIVVLGIEDATSRLEKAEAELAAERARKSEPGEGYDPIPF